MEDPTDVTAALIVTDLVRVHGDADKITLTQEQLHAAIVEALNLHNMELPYGTEIARRPAGHDSARN